MSDSFMEYLKEVKEIVNSVVPKEAEITSVDLEGPEVAVYTKNPKVFHDNEDYVRAIAQQLKKKVNIRADKSLLVEEKEAKELIMKIVPEDAKISDIQFMEPFSEVVIEALKPGLVIGKGSRKEHLLGKAVAELGEAHGAWRVQAGGAQLPAA